MVTTSGYIGMDTDRFGHGFVCMQSHNVSLLVSLHTITNQKHTFTFTITCLEFIHLLASEANDICNQQTKKTISPEHVIAALQVSLKE